MHRDKERYRTFARRTAILAGGKLALFSLLAGRLYQLQVLDGERYTTLAEENRVNMRLLAPPRGRILDRRGAPLAVNREAYRVMLIAERARNVEATLDRLSRLIRVAGADRARVLRAVRRRSRFVPITVRENLGWREMARIEAHAPELPGLSIAVGRTRRYPQGESAAHVSGYVGAATEDDLQDAPLLRLPDVPVGKTGIEKSFDLRMRGKAGTSQVEVNALGRVVRELSRRDSEPGGDVVLTLDAALQAFVAERLRRKRSGAAVLMDIPTGDLLALVSTPGFDPNRFVHGLSTGDWNRVSRDPLAPLTNKAISGQYAPGSTFKLVVALAALDAGAVDPDRTEFCVGHVERGGHRFHCWRRGGHGRVDMAAAIERSCDVYFYALARKVGIERIAGMAARLGLGRKLGVVLPGERAGLMPTPDWKLAKRGAAWHAGDTMNVGIGQGAVLATPLQLAAMTARIASRGRAVTPRIVRPEDDADAAPAFGETGVSGDALAFVLHAMDRVSNATRGTAYPARIDRAGMELAGKTGTSQVRRISEYERSTRVLKNHERPWRHRDHALFVGHAPLEAPRYAIAVVIEHGGSSKVAAAIARDVLLETQQRARGGSA